MALARSVISTIGAGGDNVMGLETIVWRFPDDAIVSGSLLSYRHGNGPWSPVEPIDPHGGLDAISCPTTSFCMAADAGGSVTTWTGGSWSAPRAVLPEATDYPGIGTSLSCTRGRFCMLMNADGDFSTYAAS